MPEQMFRKSIGLISLPENPQRIEVGRIWRIEMHEDARSLHVFSHLSLRQFSADGGPACQ